MDILKVAKVILTLIAIVFIFINWKIALGVFLLATLVHVLPLGPNALMSALTGYLIIGGIIALFFNWKIGVALVGLSLCLAKFRVWSNKCNNDYYDEKS